MSTFYSQSFLDFHEKVLSGKLGHLPLTHVDDIDFLRDRLSEICGKSIDLNGELHPRKALINSLRLLFSSLCSGEIYSCAIKDVYPITEKILSEKHCKLTYDFPLNVAKVEEVPILGTSNFGMYQLVAEECLFVQSIYYSYHDFDGSNVPYYIPVTFRFCAAVKPHFPDKFSVSGLHVLPMNHSIKNRSKSYYSNIDKYGYYLCTLCSYDKQHPWLNLPCNFGIGKIHLFGGVFVEIPSMEIAGAICIRILAKDSNQFMLIYHLDRLIYPVEFADIENGLVRDWKSIQKFLDWQFGICLSDDHVARVIVERLGYDGAAPFLVES